MSLQQFIFRGKIKRLWVFSKLGASSLEMDSLGNIIKKANLTISGEYQSFIRKYIINLLSFFNLFNNDLFNMRLTSLIMA